MASSARDPDDDRPVGHLHVLVDYRHHRIFARGDRAIFITHLSVFTLLVVGIVYVATHGMATLTVNLTRPSEGGVLTAIFFGFSAALLGISGLESSANLVEEQADGVFPKTLRNMWIAVSVFNPVLALLALALVPTAEVKPHRNDLLARMGVSPGAHVSAGASLSTPCSCSAGRS